eukprot:gb/GFBE01066213.1/.p1 GENE.gb/GFBE01066213.1/~~gb/GFBE01066213.1/.p1  ORF type:complete len:293 (+),score=78.75 gb/GFBE01066213.1/:1-879(+)
MALTWRWPGSKVRAPLLVLLLLLSYALPAVAYGSGKKKSKFLAAYPMVFKFLLFWWCVFVFAVMFVYIVDHLFYRRYGPAKVTWNVEHTFRGGTREQYWAQLADPSKWSEAHPVVQTADVDMVSWAKGEEAKDAVDVTEGKDEKNESTENLDPLGLPKDPKAKLDSVPLGPLKTGLGMVLRHKADSGPRGGSFFCLRECKQVEEPSEGPYLLIMKTVEAGVGFPFLDNSEVSEVELFPAAEDGSIRCKMVGTAEVTSRIFRWWAGLQKNSTEAAVGFLESIAYEVSAPKTAG